MHRQVGFADVDPDLHRLPTKHGLETGPALSFRARKGLDLESCSSPRFGVIEDKVMAGGTPANPATMVGCISDQLDIAKNAARTLTLVTRRLLV